MSKACKTSPEIWGAHGDLPLKATSYNTLYFARVLRQSLNPDNRIPPLHPKPVELVLDTMELDGLRDVVHGIQLRSLARD